LHFLFKEVLQTSKKALEQFVFCFFREKNPIIYFCNKEKNAFKRKLLSKRSIENLGNF
jgi:hypothetical protein